MGIATLSSMWAHHYRTHSSTSPNLTTLMCFFTDGPAQGRDETNGRREKGDSSKGFGSRVSCTNSPTAAGRGRGRRRGKAYLHQTLVTRTHHLHGTTDTRRPRRGAACAEQSCGIRAA
ncbi:hypothetical protein EVAR_79970_1 [Eumeta japonica]|uniref:Uncharacterized protein n=1 Tax=Eumeta variegata TaxID=151549 RepID=A0A4C1Y5Q2_EUMVA|nr:hypothetical protein EVAR_79970_1 [Eumeta japonica]